jgi:hypothetical protein
VLENAAPSDSYHSWISWCVKATFCDGAPLKVGRTLDHVLDGAGGAAASWIEYLKQPTEE